MIHSSDVITDGFRVPELSNWVAFRHGARGFDSRRRCDARHRVQLYNRTDCKRQPFVDATY